MSGMAQEKKKLEEYLQEFPADREKVWNLLETYSKIPPDEIGNHLRDIVSSPWRKQVPQKYVTDGRN